MKKNFIRILFFITISFLLLLVLSNLSGILNPSKWWPVSLLGLVFPFLLIMSAITGIGWLFIKPKISIYCLAAIILSTPNILLIFAFNYPTGIQKVKSTEKLRVVSWNVNLMNYSAPDNETAIKENEKIFIQLRELNADIICLQEFFTAVIPDKTYNFIDSIQNHLGYPYYYFSRDYPKFEGKFFSGTIIFSKYKIIDSSKTLFPKPISGSIIKTTILYLDDTIDVVSTHLQNINFGRDEDRSLKDSSLSQQQPPGRIERLKFGYKDQVKQVETVQKLLEKNNHPLIFAGDLNDVPTSYTYRNIKRQMKDVWLQKGAGTGATFNFIIPTLRIDYIFTNQFLKVNQTDRIISSASDHYGIVTDLYLIKKEQ